MNNTDTSVLQTMVDCDAYALLDPSSHEWRTAVQTVRSELQKQGCSVLTGFIRPEVIKQLESEGEAVAPNAYYTTETVNVFNTDPTQSFPEGHPGCMTFERGNAFVARDQIPTKHLIQQLYTHSLFKQFLADCFAIETLYELSDPLAGLCLNVLQTDREHPWHFDTNEFTVSLLTKSAEQGGTFQYCPNIRSPEHENLTDVNAVITNQAPERVRHLNLQAGDLQLFMGRYSLHRVSPVKGDKERHTAIFAYTKLPNVIGNVERTRQLFGRVLPEHYAAQKHAARSDSLID